MILRSHIVSLGLGWLQKTDEEQNVIVMAGHDRADGHLTCVRCGAVMVERKVALHRQWPPPPDWHKVVIKGHRVPIKLRDFQFILLLCPEHDVSNLQVINELPK